MKKLRKIFCIPEIYLGLLLAVFGYFAVAGNVVASNVKITRAGEAKSAGFPILQKMKEGELFSVAFDISASGGAYDLHVVPDDCMQNAVVNGEEVSLEGIQGLCNYSSGFIFHHDRFKGTGRDHFEFELKNSGGPGGLNVEIVYSAGSLHKVMGILFWVAFCLLCVCVMRRFRIPAFLLVILLLGIVLRIAFTESLPSPSKFGHDADGHIAYVQYIVDNAALPSADDCWTCYHPPVYFAAVAPAWKFASVFNVSGDVALQMMSLFMSIAILLMGFFVLRRWLNGTALNIATLLWTFWPVMIISSSRIGNDQLFYLFHIVCLWGSVVYAKDRSGKHLLVAAVASLLAIWTKTTGAISVGICVLAFLFGYFGPVGWMKFKKSEIAAIAVMVLTVAGYVAHMVVSGGGLVGNADGLHSGLKVGNGIVNFVYFDLQQWIAQPFVNAWDNELGRQYFWNYMMKTSLFGEFQLLRKGAGMVFAEAVVISFLILLVYAIRGFWKKNVSGRSMLFTAQLVAFVLALAFLRYQHPYSCSNDFRYIAPVLLSVIPFMSMGVTVPGASRKSRALGITIALVFAVSSVVTMFFVMGSF